MKFDVIHNNKVITSVDAQDTDHAGEMVSTMYPDNYTSLSVKRQKTFVQYEDGVIADVEKNWECTHSDAQGIVLAANNIVKECYRVTDDVVVAAKKIMVGDSIC